MLLLLFCIGFGGEATKASDVSEEAILVTGGSQGGAEDMQTFSSSELILSNCKVAPLPVHSYEHATLAMIDNTILSCSGQLGPSCYQLSVDLASWIFHSSLPNSFDTHTRALATVLPAGAFLVGRNSGAFLPTGSTQWEELPMPSRDARQSCIVPGSETSILIIGGYGGTAIDEYESQTGTWTTWGQGLPEKREGPSCAKLGDQVFIVGGYNRGTNDYDGATIILDLQSKSFRRGGDLTWERHHHQVAALSDGRLLAFGGGYSGDDEIEEWDSSAEVWRLLDEHMDEARANFGSTTVNVSC